jgi:pimeloyl-ACP methyl ester carboxylesterase
MNYSLFGTKHMTLIRVSVFLILLLNLPLTFAQESPPTMLTVAVGRDDHSINALVAASKKTDAALLFFRGTPDKDAVVKISSAKNWEQQFQFLQSHLNSFRNAGISVVVVGCPSDQLGWYECYDDYRRSKDHAKDIKSIISKLKTEYGIKKFYVLGHSSGAISSKWLSVNLKEDLAGAIHSSSMTKSYGRLAESIVNFDMARIEIPTLNVHHENDSCPSSPYATVKRYSQGNLVTVTGGGTTGAPCARQHHHSFEDRTSEVADAMIRWITTKQVVPSVGQ